MTHICVGNLTIIGSNNGLLPDRHQAIIWTNAGILLIRTSGTNFSEKLSEIHIVSFTKMNLKVSSAKWRPFCLGLNVLRLRRAITSHRKQLGVSTYLRPCLSYCLLLNMVLVAFAILTIDCPRHYGANQIFRKTRIFVLLLGKWLNWTKQSHCHFHDAIITTVDLNFNPQ